MKAEDLAQPELFEEFTTARPGNALFCHQDFLEKLEAHKNDPVGKRAALILHRLVVDERRQHYKSTQGANRGWRRSRLLKGAPGFENAPDGAVFLRDIRHHDDHAVCNPQALAEQYLPITVPELRRAEYVPSPWTAPQTRFSAARQPIRLVKGFPGSGKTTALWLAADNAATRSVLYVTYSAELAALARDHFDKYAPAGKRFHVVTFPRLLREILGVDTPVEPQRESRDNLSRELAGLPPRMLGVWANYKFSLYEELHAHLVGSALPVAVGRFPSCKEPQLSDVDYRVRWERHIGRTAVEALLEIVGALRRRDGVNLQSKYFPELGLAWQAATRLHSASPALPKWFLDFDCIAVDEAQDLTPIEALAMIHLAAAIQNHRRGPLSLLVAGDEAQTVRPTDFEWGWFHDLLHHRLGNPVEFKLGANLRSPRRIAELVNRVWDLYSHLAKQDRPGGTGLADIDEDASDQVIYCSAVPGAELNELLTALSEREGLAIICLDDSVPSYVPELLRHRILTVSEAKGLDFHSVCLLDPGRHLDQITRSSERLRRDDDIASLSKRLEIDQLRVAISRPTERLYFLDVSPPERAVENSQRFLEVSPVIPAVVLKTLEEELLDPEERVRLCEADARQFLDVKPEMAWSRAKQAVLLLGVEGQRLAITDETVQRSAHLTLAQVSFCLAYRRVRLPAELGHPDLFEEARQNARRAGKAGLAAIFEAITDLERNYSGIRELSLQKVAAAMVVNQREIEPWLLVEISNKSSRWLEELEASFQRGDAAAHLADYLPRLFQVLGVPDAKQRTARLYQKAVTTFMKGGRYNEALTILNSLGEPQYRLQAECREGLREYAAAAGLYRVAGCPKDALRNYRAIPDMDNALEMIAEVKDHPAAEALEWVRQVKQVAGRRPANFNKVMTQAEKKYLQTLLEEALGVTRAKKTAAPKKTGAVRKVGRPRKSRPF
ncbi:MAG: hypothetical protein HY013_08820 [Candidatus Solibacter usitatus]|nr:hypothetical protein [Candidatus Solibacter usitatus]